jgi:hypothetical protein
LNSVEEMLVEEVKSQWKRMWKERIDDRVRAEGVASMDFDKLFVERGTVLMATRNFRLLSLREILNQHNVTNVGQHVPVNPQEGGWGKFSRTMLPRHQRFQRRRKFIIDDCADERQQLKKGGRGWLHV